MNTEFKVGDIVEVADDLFWLPKSSKGRVLEVDDTDETVAVVFGRTHEELHGFAGRFGEGYDEKGYWFYPDVGYGACDYEMISRIRLYDRHLSAQDKLDKLKKYFISGNEVPVKQATIKAKDFWKIYNGEEA